ncbi:MAG: 2-dehydropantoate 2-reductase N-terminal domain-containing protein, partial [Candidatus Diapherotrites archaeon]|nr:2-dehydropantoate 2-reductase N-terminal domain-containing protein [Candidatus Diapherotrites archaeon]
MKITVVGTGYVGLVTGTCLAELGNTITCVDNNAAKIDALNRGEIPIYEPGLADLVKRHHAAKRLLFSTDMAAGIDFGDIIFIAVGTPSLPNGEADL